MGDKVEQGFWIKGFAKYDPDKGAIVIEQNEVNNSFEYHLHPDDYNAKLKLPEDGARIHAKGEIGYGYNQKDRHGNTVYLIGMFVSEFEVIE